MHVKSLRSLVQDFRNMKIYFAVTIVLFIAGIWLGAELTVFNNFLEQQIEGLEDLALRIENSGNETLALFLFIFFNNAIKAVAIVFLGMIFAFLPVFFVVVNGMVLGYLFGIMHAAGENIVPLIIKGILPHGIIELPVILLAAAYGIRLGIVLIKWIVTTGETKARNKAEMYHLVRLTGPLSIFIVISLLLAAVIESVITPMLLTI